MIVKTEDKDKLIVIEAIGRFGCQNYTMIILVQFTNYNVNLKLTQSTHAIQSQFKMHHRS